MSLGILDLPPEINRIVLQGLSKEHPPSVRAFAGASRTCHTLARQYLFQTLRLNAKDRQGLYDLVETILQTLQLNSSFKYVVRLVIAGKSMSSEISEVWTRRVIDPDRIGGFADDLHGSLDRYESISWSEATCNPSKANCPPDDAWLPVANLIQRLPSLRDLVFLCPLQFPPCLLAAIHRHHPQCRLHIGKFFLWSLKSPVTDSYDFQLATSPCLFSVNAEHENEYFPDSTVPDPLPDSAYHNEALMHMASGLAANLKEVTLVCPMGGVRPYDVSLPPWEGFSQEKDSTKTKGLSRGALRYLRFNYARAVGKHDIKPWAGCTDFSVLEVLKLESAVTSELLHYLATEVDFTRLKTLALAKGYAEDVYPAIKLLLQKLRPLSSLTMKGWSFESVLDEILNAHGASLIELELKSRFPKYDPAEPIEKHNLANIGQCCSRLQRLDLTLNRTEGDSEEVALYRTIGSLPQLKDVSLTLYIPKTWDYIINDIVPFDDIEEYAIDPRFDDEFDQKIPKAIFNDTEASNGIHRNRLINCAVDSALGRAIFAAISAGKPKGAVQLEKLGIQMIHVDNFGQIACLRVVGQVLRYLSRPLQVTRDLSTEYCNKLLVERQEFIPDFLPEIPDWLEDIWRRIWPKKLADEWWNDWHSLPLNSVDV